MSWWLPACWWPSVSSFIPYPPGGSRSARPCWRIPLGGVRFTSRSRPGSWLLSLGDALLSWGRGIGSATGLYFLEPLIFANVPAFLWLSYYGWRIAALARA